MAKAYHLKCNFQAEHGPDSQVVLVIAGDGVDLNAIQEEIRKQCQALPRGEFALQALSHSFTVLARDMLEVCLSAITRTSEGPAGMSIETIASLFC